MAAAALRCGHAPVTWMAVLPSIVSSAYSESRMSSCVVSEKPALAAGSTSAQGPWQAVARLLQRAGRAGRTGRRTAGTARRRPRRCARAAPRARRPWRPGRASPAQPSGRASASARWRTGRASCSAASHCLRCFVTACSRLAHLRDVKTTSVRRRHERRGLGARRNHAAPEHGCERLNDAHPLHVRSSEMRWDSARCVRRALLRDRRRLCRSLARASLRTPFSSVAHHGAARRRTVGARVSRRRTPPPPVLRARSLQRLRHGTAQAHRGGWQCEC